MADNITTTVPSKPVDFPINRAKIVLSSSIESLVMTNVTGSGTSLPQILKLTQSSAGEYTYTYGTILLNGVPQ